MAMRHSVTIFIGLFLGLISVAQAQPDEGDLEDGGKKAEAGSNVGIEAGFFLGNLLPNQVAGVTEITGVGGVRGGYRMGKTSFAEGALAMGNGYGAEWKNVSVSLRMDIPVETLVGFVYGGPDIYYYKGATSSSNRMIFGGHVGGGIQALISGDVWFRADMKFGMSPGTSLLINAGFVFRMPGDKAGGAE